jgi:transcriptional regulator with XRE-family HTH domain
MNYGRSIRLARAARNISQKELAGRASLDPSHISLIESDQREPSVAALTRIAEALSVPQSLLTLLACDSENLKGVSEEQAAQLGRLLLGILTERKEVS